MKGSNKLYELVAEEENDFKAMGYFVDALREKRYEKFEDNWKSQFDKHYKMTETKMASFKIETTEFGIIEYFPKCNKVHIHKTNKWIKPGLNWMIRRLLNKLEQK